MKNVYTLNHNYYDKNQKVKEYSFPSSELLSNRDYRSDIAAKFLLNKPKSIISLSSSLAPGSIFAIAAVFNFNLNSNSSASDLVSPELQVDTGVLSDSNQGVNWIDLFDEYGLTGAGNFIEQASNLIDDFQDTVSEISNNSNYPDYVQQNITKSELAAYYLDNIHQLETFDVGFELLLETNSSFAAHVHIASSVNIDFSVSNAQNFELPPVKVDIYGSNSSDTLNGTSNFENIFGLRGNDTLNGFAGNDCLFGHEGNDILNGGFGDDILYGGNGNDTLNGNLGNDLLFGEDGRDKLFGGLGDDRLIGSSGRDNLSGNDGNDVLDGGDDNDRLFGGEGNDLLIGGLGNDLLVGDEGDDLIIGNEGNDNIRSDQGNDFIDAGPGNDRIRASSGDDIVYGGDGKDNIAGEDDNDQIFGGADDDRLNGNNGDDFILGEQGDDRINGGNGIDFIDGGDGADRLDGDGGNDFIFGGSGDDIIIGDRGNDYLFGGLGNDTLSGGNGNDIFDELTIGDTASGGRGADLFNYKFSAGAGMLDINGQGQSDIINLDTLVSSNWLLNLSNGSELDYNSGFFSGTALGSDVSISGNVVNLLTTKNGVITVSSELIDFSSIESLIWA